MEEAACDIKEAKCVLLCVTYCISMQ